MAEERDVDTLEMKIDITKLNKYITMSDYVGCIIISIKPCIRHQEICWHKSRRRTHALS
jgi:hypothetical protein